ncbi:MAG TPA: ATP-binding protein, partial [Sphingobacteriaceae bacterium]
LADPDMLQVIIRNLINNSIKFTKPGGEIHIECRQLKTNCLFAVRDTGIGMSNNKLAEIFSLKAHSTYGTHNEKGVGLGLILCNEFTEAQNGKIWVESTEGQGTVFYISLPSDEKALEKARQIELFSL